jgi:hypothetical protein
MPAYWLFFVLLFAASAALSLRDRRRDRADARRLEARLRSLSE